ncbi:Receptor-like protein [Arachis hypogaea]|nr:Receptor-like protein [Arachis hypogaea]
MRISFVPWLSFIFCYWYWTHHGVAITVWNGVTCFDNRHVSGLDLSLESIQGGFDNSSSLFSLQNLQVLNLAINNFNSVIPAGFNKLKNLTYLNLSYAGFVGDIPVEISQLTRLVTLDISSSYSYFAQRQLRLKNPNMQKIVQKLTRIRQLYLDGVTITAQGHEWCNALLQLPNLLRGKFSVKIFEVATLSDIDISFNMDLHGPLPEFSLNGHLRKLVVSDTSLSGALPVSISNLSQLSHLDLSFSQFNGTLPISLSKLKELTYLDLSFNNFSGPVPSFYMSKKLTHLDMSFNLLNGCLPPSLFTLPCIRLIQLSDNNFQCPLHLLSSSTSNVLETLDLSNNNLRGSILVTIFQFKSLGVLQLSSNKFNGTIQIDMFQKLEYLTTLDLSQNNLLIDANVRDSHLSFLPKMRNVKLASCNLTKFPSFIRNQSKLVSLDLSSNNIQGSIPRWIWQLGSLIQFNISNNFLTMIEGPVQNASSTLSVIDLHSNQLRGNLPVFPVHATYLDYSMNDFSSSIPPKIGSYLSSIIFMSLSRNRLVGSLPESLCNNSNLLVLDFSYNQLKGTIPRCLMQSETIVVLNLQHNQLSGNIDFTFLVSCALRTLNLNGNQLVGPIPKTLSNCKELEVLNIGNNHFNDGFPCFLKKLSTLRVMVLRENKMHGIIGCPNISSNWQMLQIVDLALNNFSGLLPGKAFKTWKSMMLDEDPGILNFSQIQSQVLKYYGGIYYHDSVTVAIKGIQVELVKILNVFTIIDFSSNKLQGPIPEELMNLTGLVALNLSHNALTGHIPPSIGNLRQLESLDLSSTQLQSFEATSFAGNARLCGPPLTRNRNEASNIPNANSTDEAHTDSRDTLDLSFLLGGVGFGVGAGLSYTPIDNDDETEEDAEEEDSDMDEESDYSEDQDIFSYLFQERYCVSCSKFDISNKKLGPVTEIATMSNIMHQVDVLSALSTA